MNLLTRWLRSYLPPLPVDDAQLAEDLTLRGIAVEGVFPAGGGGSLFEMDITTNRVDAMNHYGVAREAAAIYDLPLAPLEAGPAAPVAAAQPGEPFPVRIEAADLCGRFTARVIRGVRVGPATGELAALFAALGQKGISGPVDATNFGWLAMGQPTHVFDLDTVEGGLVVRRAHAGERLRLLDGTERTLAEDDLVVADERKALGLAGVMGGWDSRVTEATRNILVEAAWFAPAAIRASSRRHGLHTDASHRFERGADFAAAPLANHLVTRLVLEQAGGEVFGPITDVIVPALQARTEHRPPVLLRVARVAQLLGQTLESGHEGRGTPASALNATVIRRMLGALGCNVVGFAPEDAGSLEGEPSGFQFGLPSWRLDLEREIDLVEEIARVYGYNRFANTLPGWAGGIVEPADAAARRTLRSTLRSLGYTEAVSNSFLSAQEADLFGERGAGTIAVENPLSDEAGYLRPALTAAMAGMLAKNLHRDEHTVRLFELGTVFTGSPERVEEREALALGFTGGAAATQLYGANDALFFTMKGTLERLLSDFAGVPTFDAGGAEAGGARAGGTEGASAVLPPWIEPRRGARVLLDGKPIAVFGELSAAESQRRKLRQACVLAEVRADLLLRTPLRGRTSQELSRFQAVERDLSFILPDAVRWQEIFAAVANLRIAELTGMEPVEIFRDPKGKAVSVGSYSLLLRFRLQSDARTLREEELTDWSDQVVGAITQLGGVQRAPEPA